MCVQWHQTITTNCLHPFDKRSHVKSDENCSGIFREEDAKRYHDFMHMHIPGERVENSKNFDGS